MSIFDILGDMIDGLDVTIGGETIKDVFTVIGEALDDLTSDVNLNLDDLFDD